MVQIGERYVLDEVEDEVLELLALVPMNGNAEEGEDVGGRPAVHAEVNSAGVFL